MSRLEKIDMQNESEFKYSFPVFFQVISHPYYTLLLSVLLASCLLPFGKVYALSAICLWTCLCSFWLERKMLARILVPPFTAYSMWSGLGCGVGIPLMVYAQSQGVGENYSHGIINEQYGLILQLVHLGVFPLAWGAYWLGGFRLVHSLSELNDVMPEKNSRESQIFDRCAWFFFWFSIMMFLTKSFLGLEDRGAFGPYGPYMKLKEGGFHILLSIFPYLAGAGFLFFFKLYRSLNQYKKIGFVCLAGFVLLLAAISGGRSFFVSSVISIILGAYYFRTKSLKRADLWFSLIFIALLTFSVFVEKYRSLSEFQQSKGISISERVQTAVKLAKNFDFSKDAQWLYSSGYSIYRYEDAKVYCFTPQKVPFARAENFSAVVYTWMPSWFFPEKPKLLDYEYVAGRYQNPPGVMRGFQMTLVADGYRRFGISGMIVAVVVAFALYGWIIKQLFDSRYLTGVSKYLFMLFPLLLVFPPPFGTILTTWWQFAYNIPKHILLIICVSAVITGISKKKKLITLVGDVEQ